MEQFEFPRQNQKHGRLSWLTTTGWDNDWFWLVFWLTAADWLRQWLDLVGFLVDYDYCWLNETMTDSGWLFWLTVTDWLRQCVTLVGCSGLLESVIVSVNQQHPTGKFTPWEEKCFIFKIHPWVTTNTRIKSNLKPKPKQRLNKTQIKVETIPKQRLNEVWIRSKTRTLNVTQIKSKTRGKVQPWQVNSFWSSWPYFHQRRSSTKEFDCLSTICVHQTIKIK